MNYSRRKAAGEEVYIGVGQSLFTVGLFCPARARLAHIDGAQARPVENGRSRNGRHLSRRHNHLLVAGVPKGARVRQRRRGSHA